MSDAEIRSNFNADIFEFKRFKEDKNALSKQEIDLLIEQTETFQNYQFVKKFNLNQHLNKLSSQKLDEFISAVKQTEHMKDGEEAELVLKRFSDLERDRFLQKLNSIYQKQSQKLSKYLAKLIAHFKLLIK